MSVWAAALLVVAAPAQALAQAWVPPPGVWVVSSTYQHLSAPEHTDSQGNKPLDRLKSGPIRAHSAQLGLNIGVTARIGLSVGIPYISSRYFGGDPHRSAQGVDDGSYHGGFQDFRLGLRYNLRARPLAVTPFVEGVVPSHSYPAVAHNAIGKDLRGLAFGVATGGILESALVYFQAQYAYTIRESVEGFRPNASTVNSELGYFLTDRLVVRAFQMLEVTHEGLDFPEDYVDAHIEHLLQHDRINKTRLMTLGGGVSFAAGRSWDVHASLLASVWSENAHTVRLFAVGVSRYFQFGRPRVQTSAPAEASNAAQSRVARLLR